MPSWREKSAKRRYQAALILYGLMVFIGLVSVAGGWRAQKTGETFRKFSRLQGFVETNGAGVMLGGGFLLLVGVPGLIFTLRNAGRE